MQGNHIYIAQCELTTGLLDMGSNSKGLCVVHHLGLPLAH